MTNLLIPTRVAAVSQTEIEAFRKHTIERCIIDNFIVDSPDRDRAIWAEDLYVSGPAAMKYVLNGERYWKNTLLAILSRQYSSGKLPACLDMSRRYRAMSPFSDTAGMWWAISAHEYLEKTGDTDFREIYIQTMNKLLDYYTSYMENDGLYRCSMISFEGDWTILRPRRSVLANVLFYHVLQIAETLSLRVPVRSDEFKKRFQNVFWSQELGGFVDSRQVLYLDANALSVTFGLIRLADTAKILSTLSRFETQYGPVSYIGTPRHITNWHTDLISPFTAYLYVQALFSKDMHREGSQNYDATMTVGIAIAKKYFRDTLPEFWKRNGDIWTKPATHPGQLRVSCCHGWSTFGDLSL